MNRLLIVLMACTIGSLPVKAAAQHPAGPSGAAIAPEHSGCQMCHGPHSEGGGPYALRTGRLPGVVTSARVSGAGISHTTQSCLRCHATPSIRASQPDFAGQLPATGDEIFLGLDLSNDHPIGRITDSDWPWRQGRASSASGAAAPTPLSVSGLGSAELECTTCHDPHDRTGTTLGPERQQLLCGSCHEPERYVLAGHSTLTCSTCHNVHGGHETELLAEPIADVLCNSCHGPGGTLIGSEMNAMAVAAAPEGHLEPQSERCTVCHTLHR